MFLSMVPTKACWFHRLLIKGCTSIFILNYHGKNLHFEDRLSRFQLHVNLLHSTVMGKTSKKFHTMTDNLTQLTGSYKFHVYFLLCNWMHMQFQLSQAGSRQTCCPYCSKTHWSWCETYANYCRVLSSAHFALYEHFNIILNSQDCADLYQIVEVCSEVVVAWNKQKVISFCLSGNASSHASARKMLHQAMSVVTLCAGLTRSALFDLLWWGWSDLHACGIWDHSADLIVGFDKKFWNLVC